MSDNIQLPKQIDLGLTQKINAMPFDPIEFIYSENWITISSIGSIFTFGLVNNFKTNVFDKIMGYVLPIESFQYMKIKLPDIGITPDLYQGPSESVFSNDPNEIDFGVFIRETIIWIFMTLILYILSAFIRFPDKGGFTFNSKFGDLLENKMIIT